MSRKLLSLLALTALCANEPDVPPLPPSMDEERDGWFRPQGPRRLSKSDRAAMDRAEAKRQRKNAARLAQTTQAAG